MKKRNIEGGKEGDDEEEYGDGKEVISGKEMKIRKAELRIKVMALQMTIMKKSKNGFPELGLPITSVVLSGKQIYVCPLEGSSDAFQRPRTCDAHLKRHLGMSMDHVTSVDILARVETHLISTNALQELRQVERNRLREVQM